MLEYSYSTVMTIKGIIKMNKSILESLDILLTIYFEG